MLTEIREKAFRTLLLAALLQRDGIGFSDIYLLAGKSLSPGELKEMLLKMEMEKLIVEKRINYYSLPPARPAAPISGKERAPALKITGFDTEISVKVKDPALKGRGLT